MLIPLIPGFWPLTARSDSLSMNTTVGRLEPIVYFGIAFVARALGRR